MQAQQVIKLNPNRRSEWPIVRFWYTSQKGKTIEEIIDTAPGFFEWAVGQFLNVTPQQAQYYTKRIGKEVPKEVIKDVEPYEWISSDSDKLYESLCEPNADYNRVILTYRGYNYSLF